MNLAAHWTGWMIAAALAGSLAQAQTTEIVSLDSAGTQSNAGSSKSSVSADGRFVAFASSASNLVAGDTNGFEDVFVRDRQLGTTTRVSVATGGAQGNSFSGEPMISANGNFVLFYSSASNLVANDTNNGLDAFVRDRLGGTTERVSVATGGAQANGWSNASSISGDGRFVTFHSDASNLAAGDTNGFYDVFVRDRLSGTTERVSLTASGGQANSGSYQSSISDDGRFVAFYSDATNLGAGSDTNTSPDIFVRDRQLGTTERVSVSSAGVQANAWSQYASVSADGRFVVFESYASNLVAGDTNGSSDIFVRDLQAGTTTRVSLTASGAEGDQSSRYSSISADGRYVAFESGCTNLVAGDTNGYADIFLRDRQLGTTVLVSGTSSLPADGDSTQPSVSSNGFFVGFESWATNLVGSDTNAIEDIFVRDSGGPPPPPPPPPFCFGDGSAIPCPCGNDGAAGRGCQNSASAAGALLSAAGSYSLATDTLVLTSSGELPHAASIFLQGTTAIAPVYFGDGLRCVSGALRRLYIHGASDGAVSAPQSGEPSISARSAALGDPISAGTARHYQTYYRDPQLGFCPSPPGSTWNISSGLSVTWSQ